MKFGSTTARIFVGASICLSVFIIYYRDPSLYFQKSVNHLVTTAYLSIKYIAYTIWIFLAAKFFQPQDKFSAMTWGAFRLLLGIILGYLILSLIRLLGFRNVYSFGTMLPIAYFAILVPVRWVEWWIMEKLIASKTEGVLFIPKTVAHLKWRIGGIVISFLADAPALFITVVAMGVC